MPSRLALVLSLAATSGVPACVADWPVPGGHACDGEPCEATTGSSGADASSTGTGTPTTSGSGEPASATTGDATTQVPGTTEGPAADDPVILEVELTPKYIDANGQIELLIATDHADGVRMQLDTGDVIELSGEARKFTGQIASLTGLANGPHTAWLVPWRADKEGIAVPAEYTIALPTPGSEILWEAGGLLGSTGSVAAMGVLPDDRFVELGTYFPMGEPRCYLRARDKHGAWLLDDVMFVLPTAYCTAIDLTVDPETGALHVLVNRKDDDGLRWWVGEISSWGKGAKNIATGELGDDALALARHPEMVTVCGTKKVPTGDLDAFAVLLRPNQASEQRLFDYPKGGMFSPHSFWETSRDCTFAQDTLLLVGEARGIHVNGEKPRDRLMVVEYDVTIESENWIVAGPGPGVQSRALAVDTDDQGRYHLAGYTCLDDCEPEGELRIYQPGGLLEWQNSLGPLGSDLVGPHDLAWHPAGYSVIAMGEFQDPSYVFKVQAFAPGVYEPLWTFTPKDQQGLQIAIAVAIGEFGEICAGGLGAGNYPAVACIGG